MRPATHIAHESDLAWKPQGTHGIRSKLLSKDEVSGATTLYIDIPERWKGGGVAHYHDFYEEVFVLKGDVTLNGRDYLVDGSYLYRPAGMVHGHDEGAIKGSRAIIKAGGPLELKLIHEPEREEEYPLFDAGDGRPHVLHLETGRMEWTWRGAGSARYGWKTLSEDAANGDWSALVHLPAGWQGEIALGAAHSWEWFVTAGAMTLTEGTAFGETGYGFRPAGQGGTAIAASPTGCDFLLWRSA